MIRIPANALIVVADGEGARLFRNQGSPTSISLHQFDLIELMDTQDEGPGGSMPGEASDKQIEEATFAKLLAQGLNEGALNHRYEQLVLVADPITLGRIRPQLHKEVQQRLVAEVAKTLTNSPIADIEKSLKALAA